MMSIDLSMPMRQSPKGILIIFFYNLFKFLRQSLIIIVAAIFSISRKGLLEKVGTTYFILALIFILVLFVIIAFLRYYNFKFSLINNEFHLKTGILNKETIILSKSKIQNIYIKENFLHRMIGVVSLNIESAGDKDSEIEISAIDKKIAKMIKERLFQKVENEESHELVEANTVFQISPFKLFLEGLTQNHLKSLAIIFGFIAGLYIENKDFIKDYDIKKIAMDWLNIDENLLNGIVILNLILLIIGVLISIIFSTLKMVVQNFNLKVVEHDKSIEISKGLLQTMTLTLRPKRIQTIELTTNWLKKKLGLHTLKVKQAMTNIKQANKFSIVGLNLKNLAYLVNNVIPEYNSVGHSDKVHSELFYKRVLFLRYGILTLIVNVVLAISISWYALLTFILSMAIVILCVNKTYEKTYFYFDSKFLTKGNGLVETKTNILELHKIQSVTIEQNILHKRRNLASIKIYTASQKTILPYIKKSDAVKIVDYLLYRIETTKKDWM